jgi:hypothetical protein
MGSEMSAGRAENLEFVPIVPTEIFYSIVLHTAYSCSDTFSFVLESSRFPNSVQN